MERISQSFVDRLKEIVSGSWGCYFVPRNTVIKATSESPQRMEPTPGHGAVVSSSAAWTRIEIHDPARAILRPSFRMEYLTGPLSRLALELDRHICRMFFHAGNSVVVRDRREEAWMWLNRIESLAWLHCPEQMGEISSTLLLPYDAYTALRHAMIQQFGLFEPAMASEDSLRQFLNFHGMDIFRTEAMQLGEEVGWAGPGIAYTSTAMISLLRPLAAAEVPEELSELPRMTIHAEQAGLLVEAYFQEENLPRQLTVYLAAGHDVVLVNPKQLVPVSWGGRRE